MQDDRAARIDKQDTPHKAIPVNRLLDLLSYDNNTGRISVKKSDRTLVADEAGTVTIYDPSAKIKRKIKLDVLAWVMFHKQELPNSYRIMHKNLDLEDNSAKNPLAILRQEYSKVTEAINNLEHYMKVQLHPNDQYKYVLSYRIDGTDRKETYDDIDRARQAQKDLEVYFVKLINRYAITV